MSMREMPKKGTENGIFNRILKYVNPVSMEWKNEVKGASEENINEFLQLTEIEKRGLEFPIVYLEFLKALGENDGGIFSELFYTCKFSIKNIIRCNEELYEIRNTKNYIPPKEQEYVIEEFKNNEFSIGEDELLDVCYMKFKDKNNYEISYMERCFTDFEKLLFISCVYKYEKYYMKYFKKLYINEKEKFMSIAEILEKKLNLKKEWFSDKYYLIYAKSNYTIILSNRIIFRHELFILAENENILNQIIADIENIFNEKNIKLE